MLDAKSNSKPVKPSPEVDSKASQGGSPKAKTLSKEEDKITQGDAKPMRR